MPAAAELLPELDEEAASTRKLLALVPDARFDWKPHPKSWSVGELATHIANARLMNLGGLQGQGIHYKGHALKPGTTRGELLRLLLRTSKKTIANLTAVDLEREVPSLTAPALPGWNRVLGGLIEHEIHHRSQLCEHLSAAGIEPPALYGLHAEDLPR
jgi:uncharacterized damage-inducible protein DinB